MGQCFAYSWRAEENAGLVSFTLFDRWMKTDMWDLRSFFTFVAYRIASTVGDKLEPSLEGDGYEYLRSLTTLVVAAVLIFLMVYTTIHVRAFMQLTRLRNNTSYAIAR